MKRVFTAVIAAAALLSFGAAPAFAGNHSGPEQAAKGTGATSFNTIDYTPILGTVCLDQNDPSSCYYNTPIGTTAVSTDVSESFSFDAKLGPQTDPLNPTNGAYGQMKISYQATSTTSVYDYGYCSIYYVPGGCPTPSTTVAPTQTATATADVTCLNTVQNRATVGGHVTKFSGNFTPTRGLLFNGTDNTIAGQQVAPDQFAGAFTTDVPVVCPPPSADHPITSGDVYVQQS